MAELLGSVNQRFPSGPLVIARGAPVSPVRYSVIEPEVVIFPIPGFEFSVNHTSLFGPWAASIGPAALVSPLVNSVIEGAAQAGADHRAEAAVATRPALSSVRRARQRRNRSPLGRLRPDQRERQ